MPEGEEVVCRDPTVDPTKDHGHRRDADRADGHYRGPDHGAGDAGRRRIEDLTYRYIPAYGDLARANIRSLERALSIRRVVIEKLQPSPDDARYKSLRDRYEALDGQVELEIQAARALIHGLIEKGPTLRRRGNAGPVRDAARRHQ